MPTTELDDDLEGLRLIYQGCNTITPRMRRVSLELAWDRYVVQPTREERLRVTVRRVTVREETPDVQ